MQTKLTLRLEQELIERAKAFARSNGKSVSQVVADYFERLSLDPSEQQSSPRVRALRGILKGHDVSEQDYREHLSRKHT